MDFLTVRHMTTEKYICIGRRVWSGHIHWIAGRSVPCVSQERDCPNCNPSTPRRWVGYIHVFTPDYKRDVFLTLPPGAGFALLSGLPEDYDLRGRRLSIKRDGKAITSPLLIQLDPTFLANFGLPPEKDPAEYLEEVFRKVLHLTEPRQAS
jgi:hypothetical protein